ncbi:FAD:protein FMN transferase [Paenibacillus sp. GCM10023248]|uniref:FAD:protein FMN transferase n=1 Tax=unclassified Paenibacillus TaxID=185978 RepID=UPI002378F54D|nr:FAD:protein FMN transferase [Paenibacillus sp. MAHUQ-63]MDD9265929.1 FAD:protein FMN transferase [Paenibacillus sp. MAHUQ-63]
MLEEISFRSMNTDIQVLLSGENGGTLLEQEIRAYFANAERRFSRFLPESECSSLNRLAGSRCMISQDMMNVLELCRHYYEVTEGIFHIGILPALAHAGYRRTFESIQHAEDIQIDPAPRLAYSRPDDLQLDLNQAMLSVQMPAHQQIDLGGIVKSWTVRELSNRLRREGQAARGLVNAGGDMQAWGGATGEQPWVIAIDPPEVARDKPFDEVMLLLETGAVATSSTQKRSWKTSKGSMHHLIDSRTMEPSRSAVLQCSVVGGDLIECEIWAKVMCILGVEEGLPLLRSRAPRLEALIYTADGALHHAKPLAGTSTGRWVGLQADYVYDAEEERSGIRYDSISR